MNSELFQKCFSPSSFALPNGGRGWVWEYGPIVAWLSSRLAPRQALDIGLEIDDSANDFGSAARAGSMYAAVSTVGTRVSARTTEVLLAPQGGRLTVLRNIDEAAKGFDDGALDLVRIRPGVQLDSFMGVWARKLSPKVVILAPSRSKTPDGMTAIGLSGAEDLAAFVRSTKALAPLVDALADAEVRPKVLAAYLRLGRNMAAQAAMGEDETADQTDEDLLRKSPLFDPRYYLQTNPDIAAAGVPPLSHYLSNGGVEGRAPHPLFDARYYLSKNPDVAARVENPLVHYLRLGHRQGRKPNPVFDPEWYRSQHPEIGLKEPLSSYVEEGVAARFWPSPTFDPRLYVSRNKVIAASNADPLAHYLDALRAGHDVPLPAEMSRPNTTVLVHVGGIEDWERVAEHIDAFSLDELLVTYPGNRSVAEAVLAEHKGARLISASDATEGFLAALPLLADRERCVCRINAIQGDHTALRTYLMGRALLSDRTVSSRTLHALALDETVALAGPKDFFLSASATSDGLFSRLEEGMGVCNGLPLPGEWGYFSGGSFWFRSSVVQSWTGPLVRDFFARSAADGLDAEAILERLVGASAESLRARVLLADPLAPGSADRVEVGRGLDQRQFHDLKERLAARQDELGKSVPGLSNIRRRRWKKSKTDRLGVNFVAPVEIVNGLGVSARGYHSALAATSLPISVHPWRRGFEHVKRIGGDFTATRAHPITICHLNLDLLHDANLLDDLPLRSIATKGTFNIGLPYWELLALKPEWKVVIDRFDELWVASEFMARSIRAVTSTPVRVIRPAIEAPEATNFQRSHFGIGDNVFAFFYNADASSVFARKNPECLLRAYLNAFSDDGATLLILKLNYASAADKNVARMLALIGQRKDVRIINEILPYDELQGLIQAIDCYVSPHRSEGLGLTVIEAMFAGKPVVSTAFGGVEDFISPDTAYVIPHRLTEVGEGAAPYPPGYLWADPIEERLSELLRQIASDRPAARKVGSRGFKAVETLFSLQTTSTEAEKALRSIWKTSSVARETDDVRRALDFPQLNDA